MGRPLPTPTFNATVMTKLLWQEDLTLRTKYMKLMKEDVFRIRYGETVSMERERTLARLERLRKEGMFKVLLSPTVDNLRRYDTMGNVIALLDHSLEVLLGVNFGLFGGTVARLGSTAQRDHWLPKIVSGEEFGCFALTELGHGSNVRGIETIADFNGDSFVLHSPTESSQKFWIGGAAQHATVAVVFARLMIGSTFHGIHIFIVRLRDRNGQVRPGITIADCGVKAGLNGVDNGRIWFDKVSVPRTNMLSGMCSVSRDGTYTTTHPSADAMFAATLAALTAGRIGIAYNAITSTMVGITIAVRYAHSRRAFAPLPGKQEVPLMYYSSHQRRLMIPLATAVVYLPCAQVLRDMWHDGAATGAATGRTHALSAGFKAIFTSFMRDALQSCREACGGQGYALVNRIAVMRADRDIMLTFEGANDVLMQQVGKSLLAQGVGKIRTDGDKLYNVLCKREQALVGRLGMTYKMAIRKRGSKFEAWNDCLYVAERASRAHIHRLIYEMFVKHCERAEQVDGKCADTLRLCGRLWGLVEIDGDPDFLRLGCVDKRVVETMSGEIATLCGRLSMIADELVDAFDFPEHLLAPIAGDYVDYYSRARL